MGDRIRRHLLTLSLFLLFLLILPFFLTLVIVAYCIKLLITRLVYWTDPSIVGSLGPKDALFLTGLTPAKPYPGAFITVSVVLEGRLRVQTIQDWIQKELLDRRGKNGELKYQQLQQVQVPKYGYWWWKWDRNFDIRRHVRLHEESQDWELTTANQLQCLIGLAGKQYIDMNHPLWEFLVVRNYVQEPADKEPKTAIIIRLSHSYWDGFSALKMILHGMSNIPIDWIPVYPPPQRPWLESIAYYALVLYQTPYTVFKLSSSTDTNPLTSKHKNLRDDFVVGMTGPSPLGPIRALKGKFGVSFQGTILAAVTRAFVKYTEAKGVTLAEGSKVHIPGPFPWPGHPDKICNHWTMGFYECPIFRDTKALDHLVQQNQIAREMTRSTALVSFYWLLAILGVFPQGLLANFANSSAPSSTLSNMKGPPQQLSFCEHPVLDIMYWTPLPFAALGVTVFSYRDTFKLGVGADKRIFGDRKGLLQFCSFLTAAIAEFVKCGSIPDSLLADCS